MLRSDRRILTTHAGSLPRPKSLARMLVRKSRGEEVDSELLSREIAAATREAVRRQIDAGVDIGNNGEQGRESFFTYVRERMTGFGGCGERPLMRDRLNYASFREMAQAPFDSSMVDLLRAPKAIGPVKYRDNSAVDRECSEFQRILSEHPQKFAEPFMTAASPGIVAAAMLNEHYDSYQDYVSAVADALRTEYQRIVASGMLLQIDAPDLALERHTSFADRPLGDFIDFVATNIGAINRGLEGIPKNRVRLHVCWGNYAGPHDLDVPLKEILPDLYQADVGALVLEAANPRHAHEYRCFRDYPLPNDMCLVTGVIDTKTNYIEHPEVIADRIERVAGAIGDPTRVIAGTDCGFETAAGIVIVAEEIVWAKLRAMREGAEIASTRLFH